MTDSWMCKGNITGEGLDLLPYHVNASIITRIELQYHLPDVFGAVDSACEGQNGGSLAGAWWAIKQ